MTPTGPQNIPTDAAKSAQGRTRVGAILGTHVDVIAVLGAAVRAWGFPVKTTSWSKYCEERWNNETD